MGFLCKFRNSGLELSGEKLNMEELKPVVLSAPETLDVSLAALKSEM